MLTSSITLPQDKYPLNRRSKIDITSSPRYDSFFGEEPYLFKYCPDQIIRRCVPEEEYRSVLTFCHELASGGHFGPTIPPRRSYRVVLLAYFVQEFLQLLQVMCKLPNDWKNYKKRHNAPKPYSGG